MSTAVFIGVAALASFALAGLLTRPLWRAGGSGLHALQRGHRRAVRQLARALRAGAIDRPLYDAQCRELAARLAQAVLATAEDPRTGSRGTRLAAGGVLIGVPLLVAAGYAYVGDPAALGGAAQSATPSVAQMVDGLAARLRAQPADLDGWVMLGRSYLVLGRYADAARAYAQAHRLSGADPDITANYAEALVLQSPRALTAQAAPLIEAALAAAPGNAQALWLGGLLAQAHGEQALAIQRWSTLLRQAGLPDDFRSAVRQHLQALQAPQAPQPLQPAQAAQAPQAPQPAGIDVSVSLAPRLAEHAPAEAVLFVFARPAGQLAGPPLAVRRLTVAALPARIELTGADAVMTGGTLDSDQPLQLTARVTLHGGVNAQAGDLEGQARYPGDGRPVRLIIDHLVP